LVAVAFFCTVAVALAAPTTTSPLEENLAKWKSFALKASLEEYPNPKSKCALKCTAEAIGAHPSHETRSVLSQQVALSRQC